MNRRRIFLVFARLLAFAAIAETVTIWAFWGSSWTPIERHYLSAYISCSLPVFSPGIIEVRLIWKTGHHRKRELATDEDAVDSEDGTRMELSQSAIESGWTALIESPPRQIPAEILRRGLASLAFEGQSLWEFLLLPELYALAVLCVALSVWFLAIGFLWALITEYAWRRRLSSRHQVLSSLFRDCAMLIRRVCDGFAALRRNAARRIETHYAAPRTNVALIAPEAKPKSFALPIFGVHNEAGEGYLWSDEDKIE